MLNIFACQWPAVSRKRSIAGELTASSPSGDLENPTVEEKR
jgi:hypothetical protein